MPFIWSLELDRLEGHNGSVWTVAFSPDGELLASASDDKTVRVWNLATGKELQKFEVKGTVTIMSFSASGPFLETNKGVLQVESYAPLVSSLWIDTITKAIIQEHWFTIGSENLVWLPPECRVRCSARQDNILGLGCWSGQVVFIEFS